MQRTSERSTPSNRNVRRILTMNNKDDAANTVVGILIAGDIERANQARIQEADQRTSELKITNEALTDDLKQAATAQRRAKAELADQLDDIQELNQLARGLNTNLVEWRTYAERTKQQLVSTEHTHFYDTTMLYASRMLLQRLAPSLGVTGEWLLDLSYLEMESYYKGTDDYVSAMPAAVSEYIRHPSKLKTDTFAQVTRDPGRLGIVERRMHKNIRSAKRRLAEYLARPEGADAAFVAAAARFDQRFATADGAIAICQEIDAEIESEERAALEKSEAARRQVEVDSQNAIKEVQAAEELKQLGTSYYELVRERREGVPLADEMVREMTSKVPLLLWLGTMLDFHTGDIHFEWSAPRNVGSFFAPKYTRKLNIGFQRKTNFAASGHDKRVFHLDVILVFEGESQPRPRKLYEFDFNTNNPNMQKVNVGVEKSVGAIVTKILFRVYSGSNDFTDVHYHPGKPLIFAK